MLLGFVAITTSCGDTKPKSDVEELKKKTEKTEETQDPAEPQKDEGKSTSEESKVDSTVKDSEHVVKVQIDVNGSPVKESAAPNPVVVTIVSEPKAEEAPATARLETEETDVVTTETISIDTPSVITIVGTNTVVQEGSLPVDFSFDSTDTIISGFNKLQTVVEQTGKIEGGLEGDVHSSGVEEGIVEFDMYNPVVLKGEAGERVVEENVIPSIQESAFTKLLYFFEAFYDTLTTTGSNVDQTTCVPREHRSRFPEIYNIPLMKKALQAYEYDVYNVTMTGRDMHNVTTAGRKSLSKGLMYASVLGTSDNMCISYQQLMDVYVCVYSVLLTYLDDAAPEFRKKDIWIAANEVAKVLQSTGSYGKPSSELTRKLNLIKAQVRFLNQNQAKKARKHAKTNSQ